MKKQIIIILLIMSLLSMGCSQSDEVSKVESTNALESRIIELENENDKLREKVEELGHEDDLDKAESKEVETVPEAPSKENDSIKDLNIGDTIATERMELTIKNIEFSYDVLPDDTSGFYTHYPAESGKVYIHIHTDVKNLQNQALPCDEIMRVEADYDNGFHYTSMTIPEDSSGFTYDNITSIIPLDTMGVRFLIECPQEVEETDKSLFLILKADKEEYKYIMRP